MGRLFAHLGVALLLLCPGLVRAEEEDLNAFKGLLAPCAKHDENLKQARASLTDDAAEECKDQIAKSLDACFKAPERVKLEELMKEGGVTTNFGITKDSAAQTDLYKSGQTKFAGNAQICSGEYDKVDKACKDALSGLTQAKKDNTAGEINVTAELKDLGTDNPAYKTKQSQQVSFMQTDKKLDEQKHATQAAQGLAQKALRDEAMCFVNQARVYANAATQSEVTMASTAQGEKATDAEVAKSAIPEKGDAFVDTASLKTKESLGGAAMAKAATQFGPATEQSSAAIEVAKTGGSTLLKSSGLGFAALNGATGHPREAVTGTLQTAAEFMLSPTGAARVGSGLFLATLLTAPSPLGHCDTPLEYYDPVVAYNAGCRVTTYNGSVSNEAAIQSLSAP